MENRTITDAILGMVDSLQVEGDVAIEGRIMVCPGKKPGVTGAKCYPRAYMSFLLPAGVKPSDLLSEKMARRFYAAKHRADKYLKLAADPKKIGKPAEKTKLLEISPETLREEIEKGVSGEEITGLYDYPFLGEVVKKKKAKAKKEEAKKEEAKKTKKEKVKIILPEEAEKFLTTERYKVFSEGKEYSYPTVQLFYPKTGKFPVFAVRKRVYTKGRPGKEGMKKLLAAAAKTCAYLRREDIRPTLKKDPGFQYECVRNLLRRLSEKTNAGEKIEEKNVKETIKEFLKEYLP